MSSVCDLHVAFLNWKQPSPRLEPRRRRRRPRKARHQSGFSFFFYFFPQFCGVKSFEIFFFLFFWGGEFTPKKTRLSERIIKLLGFRV